MRLAPFSNSLLRRWLAWWMLGALLLTGPAKAALGVEMTLAMQGLAAEVCVSMDAPHGTSSGSDTMSGMASCADCLCTAMWGAAWAVPPALPALVQTAWVGASWVAPPVEAAVTIEPVRGPPPQI